MTNKLNANAKKRCLEMLRLTQFIIKDVEFGKEKDYINEKYEVIVDTLLFDI